MKIFTAAISLLWLSSSVVQSESPLYKIDHLAGLDGSLGVSLNDSGDVVAADKLWYGGVIIPLGKLDPSITSTTVAKAINNDGIVVGLAFKPIFRGVPFRWEKGIMTELPNLWEGYAADINQQGDIVGHLSHRGNHHGVVWKSDGQVLDIGAIGNDHSSRGISINDLGYVIGHSLPTTGSGFGWDAFIWDGAVQTIIRSDFDPYEFEITAINNFNTVVGYKREPSPPWAPVPGWAFSWKNDNFTELGGLTDNLGSFARDINDCGWIVGSSMTDDGLRAFLHCGSQMYLLSDLVDNMSGWEYLRIAYAINNSRQIVGVGKRNAPPYAINSDSSIFILTLLNGQPPKIITATATPDSLWPPNNKLVEISVIVDIEADCDNSDVHIVEVTCNEDFSDQDVEFVDNTTVLIRASRSGSNKDGRTYTLWLQAFDSFGVSELYPLQVNVPHKRID